MVESGLGMLMDVWLRCWESGGVLGAEAPLGADPYFYI